MSGKDNDSSRAGLEERRSLLLRRALFGIAVSLLAGISGLFVFGVITQHAQHSGVELSADGFYTLRLLTVPKVDKESLEKIVESGRLTDILGVNEVFTFPVGEDYVALCVGEFDSRQSEEAGRIKERVEESEIGKMSGFLFIASEKRNR